MKLAVQNGFIGTEQDWLAQLGTSINFNQTKTMYTTESEESSHALPDSFTSNSFLDIYVNGKHLAPDKYSISDGIINYSPSLSASSTVELVVTTSSTNELPIVTTISENSTDETVPSAKAVYLVSKNLEDNKQDKANALFFSVEEEIEEEL